MATTTTTTTTPNMITAPLSSSPTSNPPPTHGKLRYIPAGHIPLPSPHNFHLPLISEFSDERLLPLHDMRPLPSLRTLSASPIQLSTHGFTALHHQSAMHSPPYSPPSWKDPRLLSALYVPETEALVKAITGARTVVTEALLLRSELWSEEDALATHAGHGNSEQDKTQLLDLDSVSKATNQEPKAIEEEPQAASPTTPQEASTPFPQFIGFTPPGGASPAPKIHQDYTPLGARAHIRHYHPRLRATAAEIITAQDAAAATVPNTDHAGEYQGPRWALFSIWRPLKPVKRDPLALGDVRSFREQDYVPIDVRTPNLGRPAPAPGSGPAPSVPSLSRPASSSSSSVADSGGLSGGALVGLETETSHVAEAYLARYHPGHRWHWVSDQKPEEVLVIGLFDSAFEGRGKAAGGAMHSSVDLGLDLEGGVDGDRVEPRESLEVRCLALW